MTTRDLTNLAIKGFSIAIKVVVKEMDSRNEHFNALSLEYSMLCIPKSQLTTKNIDGLYKPFAFHI